MWSNFQDTFDWSTTSTPKRTRSMSDKSTPVGLRIVNLSKLYNFCQRPAQRILEFRSRKQNPFVTLRVRNPGFKCNVRRTKKGGTAWIPPFILSIRMPYPLSASVRARRMLQIPINKEGRLRIQKNSTLQNLLI